MTAARTQVREYRLYRIWDWEGRLGYLGQTGRMPIERALEHLKRAGFGPLIAAWAAETDRVFYDKAVVDAAEAQAIRDELPAWNDTFNHDNPHRVQVARRSDVRPWMGRPVRRRRRWRRWPRWAVRLAWLPAMWAVLAGGIWWATPASVPVGRGASRSAMVATVVIVAVSWFRASRPRRRR